MNEREERYGGFKIGPLPERIVQLTRERRWQNTRFWAVVDYGFAEYAAPWNVPEREHLPPGLKVPGREDLTFARWES